MDISSFEYEKGVKCRDAPQCSVCTARACLKSCDDDEIPSYNIENAEGRTPLSYSRPGMLELLLQLEDLEAENISHLGIKVVNGRGRPLLWECATNGLLTETIARDKKLRGQFGMRWAGTLPLEEGGGQ